MDDLVEILKNIVRHTYITMNLFHIEKNGLHLINCKLKTLLESFILSNFL